MTPTPRRTTPPAHRATPPAFRATSPAPRETAVYKDNEFEFDTACAPWRDALEEIDVRPLQSPLLLQTIIATLDKLPENRALYVYHKRVPVPLFELLTEGEATYEIHVLTLTDTDIRLLIIKTLQRRTLHR